MHTPMACQYDHTKYFVSTFSDKIHLFETQMICACRNNDIYAYLKEFDLFLSRHLFRNRFKADQVVIIFSFV